MKKIIAAAVATAFVTPAFAADVNLSGLVEVAYVDANGTTEVARGDNAFYISATTETNNGLTVSADINLTGDGANDGGQSLDVAGPFGKIEIGDTSSAADKFDDRTDLDVMVGAPGTSAGDSAIGWTLPEMVPGLVAYVSHSADVNPSSADAAAHTGIALSYTAGPVNVAYADNNADDDATDKTYVGATVSFGGLKVFAEVMQSGASNDETEERGMGVQYSMGDLTLSYSQQEVESSADVVSADKTFVGVKYAMGGGVTAFVENVSDDKNADSDKTAAGLAFAF